MFAPAPVFPPDVTTAGHLAGLIPGDLWVRLVEVEERLWDRQQMPDRRGACQQLAEAIGRMLRTAGCAVLLEVDGHPDRWAVAGRFPAPGPGGAVPPEITGPVRDYRPNQYDDITCHTAALGCPTDEPEAALFPDLPWGVALRVPVKDRKGYPLALVTAVAPADRPFTPADAAATALLVRRPSARLENLRAMEIRQALFGDVQACESLADVFKCLLVRTIALTRATRGEVAYFNWDAKTLVIGPSHFPAGRPPPDGAVPSPSLIRNVWQTGEPLRLDRVRGIPGYFACDDATESELLVPVTQILPGNRLHRLGVLNLESSREQHFDLRDQKTIQDLSAEISAQAILTARTTELTRIVENLINRPAERRVIADSILQAVRESFGFDCGIIYIPDYPNRTLIGYVHIGTAKAQDQRLFEYGLGERALATRVFSKKLPCFVPEADTDTEVVSRRGVEGLGIRGGLLGVPLLVEEKRDADGPPQQVIAGVMVVWGAQSPSPVESDAEMLRPFARLAALVIRAAQREVRDRRFWDEVQKSVRQIQTSRELEPNLRAVMRAVLAVQFDRVRIWRFRWEDRMVPFLCDGMEPEYETGFFRCEQTIDDNPYAADLVHSVFGGEGPRPPNMLARRYPFPGPPPIPDPDWAVLGKTGPQMPWIEVPLVYGGKLYGTLAVDNKYSAREFDADDQEYVTFFGSVAAQAFTADEMRGVLNADSLAELYQRVAMEEDEGVVRRCLLRYLTHGEEGLGFPRALFLERDDVTGEFRFVDGVGSVTRTDFQRIAEQVRRVSLQEVLKDAPQVDEPLYHRLQDFTIDLNDVVADRLTRIDEPVEVVCDWREPAWATELRSSLGDDLGVVLACPVQANNDLLGVVLVDRAHSPRRPLSAGDREKLLAFCKEAGRVLALHRLRLETRALQDAANLGVLTRGLTHELRHPLGVIRQDVVSLRRDLQFRGVPMPDAEERKLRRISESTGQMADTIARLQAVVRPADLGQVIRVTEHVLRPLELEWAEPLRAKGITFRTRADPALTEFPAHPGLLLVALGNLISNAEKSFESFEPSDRLIEVIARLGKSGTVVLEVRDNGPGLPSSILGRINRPGDAPTTRPGKGLGLGLAIVRRIAYLHGRGKFSIRNDPRAGVSATILIPIQP